MTLLDEYTRQSLAIQVERPLTASEVLAVLEKAMARYGVPGYIRSDNGPEFIAAKVQQWLSENQIKTIYIDPGSPWQNGYIESFHSRFRDECLGREMFLNLREARIVISDWRLHYNQERPHSKLGYRSPNEFINLAHVGFEVKALEGEVENAYPILRGILPLFISRKRPMMIFPIDTLMDEQSGYDFLLGVLHPDGLHCPLGHLLPPNQAPHDRHRAPLYDYKCRVCGKVYNLFTDTLWQGARYPCRKIVLLMRGVAQGVST